MVLEVNSGCLTSTSSCVLELDNGSRTSAFRDIPTSVYVFLLQILFLSLSLSLFWVNQPSLCTDARLSYPQMIQEYGATVILRVQINVRHIRGRCIVGKLSLISISLI